MKERPILFSAPMVRAHYFTSVSPARILALLDCVEALRAFMTHLGMDEDPWNKPTFDQARAALKKLEEV